jgi:hypothetical protein
MPEKIDFNRVSAVPEFPLGDALGMSYVKASAGALSTGSGDVVIQATETTSASAGVGQAYIY